MTSCGEKSLSDTEYDKLLSVCESQEDKLMLMIGVTLGLRRSDLSRLLIRNINFEDGTITYLEQKKGNRSRTIPVPQKLLQEVKIYLKLAGKKLNDKLFNVGDRQLANHFYELCDKAGVERRGLHCLRATCVKNCQKSGWSIEQAAHLIGDSVSVVQKYYNVPSKGELKELMELRRL